jgi:ABC-type sugar transport system ATPase subunit
MASLELTGVGRSLGAANARTVILEGLDLLVEDGAYCVLVGPSGCGKSTTLRLVAGLDEPTSGSVSIGGRRVDGLAPHERDVAFVFQGYALYPHLSVKDNLAFGLERRRTHGSRLRALVDARYRAARRAESDAIAARIGEVARELELDALLARRPGELSGGQQQRVALGRALVRSPSVFLLDEPLSNLDARLRLELRGALRALQARLGATFVHVTHDQEEALALADRLAVLANGRLQQYDAPSVVHTRPANRFVAGFVGAPAMNFAGGVVKNAHFQGGGLAAPVGGVRDGAAVLGLRPTEVEFTATTRSGDTHGAAVLGRARVTRVLEACDHADVEVATDDGTALVVRLSGSPARTERPSVGAHVDLCAPRTALHLFEPGPFGARLEPVR